MDRQFLEFWGNYLLSVARGQKQLEDVTRWIHGGFSGVDELTALFKKYYGLEEQSQDARKAVLHGKRQRRISRNPLVITLASWDGFQRMNTGS
jgi:hypothetical protein